MFMNPGVIQTKLTLNTGGTVTADFSLPFAARVISYFAVPILADQAAHATIVDTVTFTNKGTDGDGSSVVAILTNDSDLAASTTRNSGAWASGTLKEVNCEARPSSADATNVADEYAANSVIHVDLLGAGTTPTANEFIIGIKYRVSD